MGIQGHITLPSSGYVANNNIDYFNFYFVLDDWAVKEGISYIKKTHDDVSDPSKGYWKLSPNGNDADDKSVLYSFNFGQKVHFT
ncbi:hypothetical protein ABDB91_04420 [Desulfoscipio sp. XC116]|uniref:hypothetical protein n=1 Tax=Desulfoscipio sp. XC116 TaxID=3144975 RepID=UPI00325AC6DF